MINVVQTNLILELYVLDPLITAVTCLTCFTRMGRRRGGTIGCLLINMTADGLFSHPPSLGCPVFETVLFDVFAEIVILPLHCFEKLLAESLLPRTVALVQLLSVCTYDL